jgi:regulator of sigma E protease
MGIDMTPVTCGCLVAAGSWLEWLALPANWWVVLQVAGGLGFVIFVHELGHFLVAKACGVKCEKFYLGFDVGGLKLCSFKWGETEYGIGILPLGGYVKMLGQDDNPAAAAAEAERARLSGDLPPEPVAGPHPQWDPRSYPAQSVPERMAIISAGVIMNVIFAVLMAAWAYGLGVKEMTCMISSVRPGGAAWRAGLRTGDEIVKIGSRPDPIFADLLHGITVGSVKEGIDLTVRRPADGSERTVRLKPDTDLGKPTIGVTSPFSTRLPDDITGVLAGAAARAQPPLLARDAIKAVDGQAVAGYAALLAALARAESRPVTLTIERSAGPQAPAETVAVELPPQRRVQTGMAMTPLPIKDVQEGSPAAAAGILPGDRLLGIDGGDVGDPLTLDDRLRRLAGTVVKLTIGREAAADRTVEVRPREVTWRDDSTSGIGSPASIASLGIALPVDAVVAAVDADGPAARAGIVPGDRIAKAWLLTPEAIAAKEQGPPVKFSAREPNWPGVMGILQDLPAGTALRLEVVAAGGDSRMVDLVPAEAADQFVIDRGLVFEPLYRLVRADSIPAALGKGLRKAGADLSLVYGFLGKLWNRQISARLLGGPIEIAKQAGRSASEGFSRLLLFLTMLSANLAVVNFLPIPVLDGGHMVFLVYELLRGKPPSEGVVAVLSYIGLALLLTLMMFVFGLDLGLIPRQ